MITIEAEATVTEGGHMTLHVPTRVTTGIHRVRLTVLDDRDAPVCVEPAAESKFPKPKSYFLGRPVYDEEDLRGMASDLPSEEAWAHEEGLA